MVEAVGGGYARPGAGRIRRQPGIAPGRNLEEPRSGRRRCRYRAPELRDNSRYNRDNAQIIGSYSIGLDVLSIYAEVPGIQEPAWIPT